MLIPVDPAVETSTLANGLRVTTVALPHLHTAMVGLFIKVGSRFEAPVDNGLSHFVEHMLYRGSRRYPDSLALNTAAERLGSSLHAETGRDYTLFSMALPADAVGAALELYGDLFAHPRFRDLELERALILEELNEDYDEDDVEINADDIARGLMFGDHPLAQRIIGPRRNVERFTDDDVRRHFARFYGARNATLCVAGPLSHAYVVASARAHLEQLPAGEPSTLAALPAPPPGPALRHVPDAGSQTTLSILLRGVGELDPRYAAFVAMLRVLDDGMSTRLHYQLCDQRGLAYSISAGIEPLADVALLDIAGATANAKVPDLVRALLEILDGLRAGDIHEAELDKARARYRYETLAAIDDAGAMLGWFGGTALYYPPPPLTARLAQMEAVTVDDVRAAAADVLRPDNLVLAAVGTLSKARLGELRSIVTGWR
ncbi:MAG: pitrilysin family protein [Kofleriaceae bacterium]